MDNALNIMRDEAYRKGLEDGKIKPVQQIVPSQRLEQLIGSGDPTSAEIHDMAVELLNWRIASAS